MVFTMEVMTTAYFLILTSTALFLLDSAEVQRIAVPRLTPSSQPTFCTLERILKDEEKLLMIVFCGWIVVGRKG